MRRKALTRAKQIKRTVKLVTNQSILPNETPEGEEIPMRGWDISIYLVGPDGEELPANCFEKVVYVLHESFGKRAKQTIKTPPFMIKEKGWGEFDMLITLTPIGAPKGGDQTLQHDLNFAQERYESTHSVVFRNPKPELLKILQESGPAGDANGATTTGTSKAPKRKPASRNVDMDKLAEALPQLSEDDLLQVVQMVHDNKTEETYTKNDLENGEFHVDLYTLPDNLIKMLWDFTSSRVDMSVLS
ncbi:yeats family-domain-containing protein [Neohortaea acidophila]|uniref:Yeats family-domain-containing protein n=1 Tax=Neohortaea acidophila TaxID=245834 RepID=A0A6A6Q1J5_9PEZI|nr:yeats family-domain-containing protein [Neohortaea acidophila]KAF2486358.1 yeats family-domain-containing protein [Neohortaea acidophila]